MTVRARAWRPALLTATTALAACARGPAPNGRPGVRTADASGSVIRVLVAQAPVMRVSAGGDFTMADRSGRVLAQGGANEPWRVESELGRVRAVGPNGRSTPWVSAPLVMQSDRAPVSVGSRSYRGRAAFYGDERGVEGVNWLAIDDYLVSVVASEMGDRSASDLAALEAQAVAARSYAFVHMTESGGGARHYDVVAGVADQAYGGVGAENSLAARAVESTRGLVLKYGGRVVSAPYHSTCGGSTAAWSEVFRGPDEPYLRPVSDRIGRSDRYYCDISPRFQWTKTLDAASLNAALTDYLSNYVNGAPRAPGVAKSVGVTGRTASGRAAGVVITTDRGSWAVQGNDVRSILRTPGGEILNSTYFSVENSTDSDGRLVRVTLRGMGYGHGVGMCQWGAIGRARAGQDFRTILRAYYPGTDIGRP